MQAGSTHPHTLQPAAPARPRLCCRALLHAAPSTHLRVVGVEEALIQKQAQLGGHGGGQACGAQRLGG